MVAFTFDDLPAHGPLAPGQVRWDVLRSVLATLKQEKMPPVYGFVNGFRMEEYPYQIHLLQAWLAAGQPLGNHTYSHDELDKITVKAFDRDVAKNEPLLRKVDPNGDWHWFRFPFLEEGETNEKRDAALAALHARGYKVAEISINFQDYKWNDAFGVCAKKRDAAGLAQLHDTYLAAADTMTENARVVSQRLYGRDIAYILLLHIGAFDARMLPELIAQFRAKGFRLVTLEEAAADPAYAVDAHTAIAGGATFLDMAAQAHGVSTPPDSPLMDAVDSVCK